jgi:hypothetical protein
MSHPITSYRRRSEGRGPVVSGSITSYRRRSEGKGPVVSGSETMRPRWQGGWLARLEGRLLMMTCGGGLRPMINSTPITVLGDPLANHL